VVEEDSISIGPDDFVRPDDGFISVGNCICFREGEVEQFVLAAAGLIQVHSRVAWR
jgi:hypothetical protein